MGGGAAGLSAAAGLVALGWGVEVLEAGPGDDPADQGALDSPNHLRASARPERTWSALRVRRTPGGPEVPYAQGRGVGGSSAINGGLVEVPSAADEARLRWPGLRAMAQRRAAGETVDERHRGPLDRAVAAAACALDGTAEVRPARLARQAGRRLRPGGGLTIRTGALVDRVIVDGRRAAGVRLAGGEEIDAEVVVLAAGALATPGILVRSGLDTPGVGEGLRDHAAVTLSLALHPEARLASVDATPTALTVRAGEHQLVPLGLTGPDQHGLATGAVLGVHLGGRGRGRVRVASHDPAVAPEITFDVMGDERDRGALRAIVRTLARLARAPAVAALTERATLGSDGSPLEQADATDDELDVWIAGHLAEVYHPAGTCAAGSVTDRHGCLVGYDALVVVDASILPELPRVAPQLTVRALAALLVERNAARWPAPP